MAAKKRASQDYTLRAFIVIVSLFLVWGVATGLNGVLVGQFRKAFTLDYVQSFLVNTSFYIGYFLFAIPAALFIHRFGYKAAIIVGLVLYGAGAMLFYPAAELRVCEFFLVALFVIASGLAFLETSANPLVTFLGAPETSERRLNFVQTFNAFGPISAILIGRYFIMSNVEYTPAQLAAMPPESVSQYFASAAHVVQMPFILLGLAVLILAESVFSTRFPSVAYETTPPGESIWHEFKALFRLPLYRFGVVALFFYEGAQIGIWGLTIPYAQHAMPGMPEWTAANYMFLLFVSFLVGRIVGTALMWKIRPVRLMAIYAVFAAALSIMAAFVGGMIGIYALVATSFFMSIMWPTIFASAIRGLGPLTKTGSAFLIMAIIGGAIVPVLIGFLAEKTTIQFVMVVPSACFAVVFAYAAAVVRYRSAAKAI